MNKLIKFFTILFFAFTVFINDYFTSEVLAYDCLSNYPVIGPICENIIPAEKRCGLQCSTCVIAENHDMGESVCRDTTRVDIHVYLVNERRISKSTITACAECHKDFYYHVQVPGYKPYEGIDIFIPKEYMGYTIVNNLNIVQTNVYFCLGEADCQNLGFSPTNYQWNDPYTLTVTTTNDELVDKVGFYYSPVDPNNCPSNTDFCSTECWLTVGEDTNKADGWSINVNNANLPNYPIRYVANLFNYDTLLQRYDLICTANPGMDTDPNLTCNAYDQCYDCMLEISPPSPTLTPSPSPTVTSTPTNTPSPTPTTTVTPTLTISPSPTPTTPTISPTPTDIPESDNIYCADLNTNPDTIEEIYQSEEITLTCVIGGYEPDRVEFRYQINNGSWLPPSDQWLTTTIINEVNGGYSGSITDSALSFFPEVSPSACTDVTIQCRGCVYDPDRNIDVCTAWPGENNDNPTTTPSAPSLTPSQIPSPTPTVPNSNECLEYEEPCDASSIDCCQGLVCREPNASGGIQQRECLYPEEELSTPTPTTTPPNGCKPLGSECNTSAANNDNCCGDLQCVPVSGLTGECM